MSSTEAAVAALSQLPAATQSERIKNIKSATDGLHGALIGIASSDTAKALRGIGDILVELPHGFGVAGVAFSLAASVFTLMNGPATKVDPVLVALGRLSETFHTELSEMQEHLRQLDSQLSSIIVNVDRVLSSISAIPSKVVAEMKMTAVSVMKDKFANVQRHAMLYAQGNLTSAQMLSKCEDFAVASLFSELETILRDENRLFDARFETLDSTNGNVQTQLLAFYIAVLPLVTNCNALEYSFESLDDDWTRSRALIQTVLARAAWYLTPPDRVVHVNEKLVPFSSVITINRFSDAGDHTLALSFRAFSLMPPHGVCFDVTHDGRQLAPLALEPGQVVPHASAFCVKTVPTDDAPQRVVYAERDDSSGVSIVQPEVSSDFDPLAARDWAKNAVAFYSPKVGNWKRFPVLTLVADFVILQAASAKVSLEDLTRACTARGDGYVRDGDGHSVDYKGAPWTIFCVRYVKRSIREIDDAASSFLVDVQFNEMEAAKAWTAACPSGYVRDKHAVAIPSQVKKSWLTGTSTTKAFAVCLKWAPMSTAVAPSHFVQRVWLDDSVDMSEKPKREWNKGDSVMALPPRPEDVGAF